MPVDRVHAHYETVRRLGHWTDDRRFEVRARRGTVVLDLRSPRIPDGDIEVDVDLDRATLKLLVPQDADIHHWDLFFAGRGRVKDWTGDNGGGRAVHLTGEIRHGEVRVHRGGVATLTAMLSREFVEDVRRARREGTTPTIADPAYGG